MVTIVFWIFVCGVVGGVTNALSERTKSTPFDWYALGLRLAQGILAAGTIPLFLQLIGNNTVSNILDPAKSGSAPESILVLIGFCLIASLFSRTYLEGLSLKVMQLRKEVEQSKEKIDAVESAVVEPPAPKKTSPVQRASLPNEAELVIGALKKGPYRIRSADGLLKQLNDPVWKEKLQPQLNALESDGLVRSVDTKFGKGWTLTAEGHNLD